MGKTLFGFLLLSFHLAALASSQVQEGLFLETPYSPEQQLQYFETNANGAARRSMAIVAIPHFEIPLKLLDVQFSNRFAKNVQEKLIFQKNGQPYVRWVINPEDTHWYLEIQDYFKEQHQLILEKKYFFRGQQTAARTYHVLGDDGQFLFAVKASTNSTGGKWTNKRQNIPEADDARFVADYVDYIQKVAPFENVVILDEPAAFKIQNLNMAVVIRDLKHLSEKSSNRIYLPAFSALHSEVGIQIARKNGSDDPNEFWNEHFVKASAIAVGELAARTGLLPSNPHAQNFLIELDHRLVPTGRIVFRDLADFFIYHDMMKVLHPAGENYKKYFKQSFAIVPRISAGLLPFSGTPAPGWLKPETMNQWQNTFFEHFEMQFLKVSGLPEGTLRRIDRFHDQSIFMGNFEVLHNSQRSESFWQNLKNFKHPKAVLRCEKVF